MVRRGDRHSLAELVDARSLDSLISGWLSTKSLLGSESFRLNACWNDQLRFADLVCGDRDEVDYQPVGYELQVSDEVNEVLGSGIENNNQPEPTFSEAFGQSLINRR